MPTQLVMTLTAQTAESVKSEKLKVNKLAKLEAMLV